LGEVGIDWGSQRIKQVAGLCAAFRGLGFLWRVTCGYGTRSVAQSLLHGGRMGRNRLPYMQFDVDDYLQDEAVMGMAADTEGLYIRLLCRSWKSSTPGVIPERLFGVMCEDHRITDQYRVLWGDEFQKLDNDCLPAVGPEMIADLRLDEIKNQLRAAFDTASKPGFWVQKRMVADFKRLSAVYEAQRRGGEQTRFRQQVPRSPEATLEATSSLPRQEVDLEVEVDREKSKSTDLATDVAVEVVRTLQKPPRTQKRKTPEEVEWERTFHEWFWPAYWRKVSKPDALRAWMGVSPKTQDMVESINEGLLRHRSVILGREKEKQPHAATWLNQRRWEDPDA
jgi:uncharacterized protein YdaU (DUF1376 family)